MSSPAAGGDALDDATSRPRLADRLSALGSWSARPAVNWTVALVVVVLVALIPFITGGYILFQLELVLIYIGAASGLNLAVGVAGEFLLCQATVIGVAAYVAGIFSVLHNWSPVATLPLAIVAGIIWQVIISIAGLRVRGLYLGVLSFFSVLVFPDLILLTSGVTGGTGGLVGISPFALPGSADYTVLPFEIAVGVAVISTLLVRNLIASGWGIRMRYLRDAPNSLAATGINIATTKLTAYIVAAIPGAIAGWALAYFSESLTSSVFGLSLTLILFAGVQLIGPGTIVGPIVGVGLLEGYSQLVGPFSAYNTLGLGVLLTVALLVLPGGLARIVPSAARGGGPGRRRVPEAEDEKLDANVLPDVNPFIELRRARLTAGVEAPEGPVLEVDGVVKSFGGNRAVDDASFTVRRGRIVALMGENGSGKTTLVNMISGFLKPDSGEVRINGRRASGAASQVARMGCARTFQVPQVVGELSVRENVEAGLLLRACVDPVRAIFLPFWARRVDRLRREAARHICEEMGFSAAQLDVPVNMLPLGLRRLVEVVRAIASSADVICLDEPAAGLNDEELDALSTTLKHVRQSGEAILLVEHNVRFVLATCDDIVLLRAGRVEGFFTDVSEDDLPAALQRHLRRATVTT